MRSSKPSNLYQNPYESSNSLLSLMFCFVMPTFSKRCKQMTEDGDLYGVLDEHKSDYLGVKLNNSWEFECIKKQQNHRKPSLIAAILHVFGLQFAILGLVLFFLEIGLRITQPLFLGGLVAQYGKYGNDSDNTSNNAYLYALAIIVCSASNVLLIHPYNLGILHMGMKIRVAVCSMVYRKALRINRLALDNTTIAQTMNLIFNDVARLDTTLVYMHYLWLGPLEIIIITFLIYLEIGICSILGVAVMLLFLPLQIYLGKQVSALRLQASSFTDERLRIMNEIISGIKVIKMYVWEIPFSKIIQQSRYKELKTINCINHIRGILQSFIMFTTRISLLVSLIGYALLGKLITAEQAFVIAAYYNTLRTTTSVYFPMGVSRFAEAIISLQRVQKFMMLTEVKQMEKKTIHLAESNNDNYQIPRVIQFNENESFKENDSNTSKVISDPHAKTAIIMKKLRAKWQPKSPEYALNNISLEIQSRNLIGVVGAVGSGKSSLLQAILGELPIESGTILVNGSLSYVPQEPWLFSGTVRENILFGLSMDKLRYRTVIQKCELEHDFRLLPFGDKTFVGESGSTLSGGQKARISLARAIYRKADIYLLDDPLSAVDINVGRQLFQKCLQEFLKNETVVLVTHQLQLLQQVELIIIMKKGRINAIGSFESLHNSDSNFAKYLLVNNSNRESDAIAKALPDKIDYEKLPRQQSTTSVLSSVHSAQCENLNLDQNPESTRNTLHLYKKYFNTSGSYVLFTITMFTTILAQILASASDYFLSYWVGKNNGLNDTLAVSKIPNNFLALDLGLFSGLHVLIVLCSLSRSLLFFELAKRSSITIHSTIFQRMTNAAMSFFSINKSGQIMNRFSTDLNQVDETLPCLLFDVLQIFSALFGVTVVLSLVNPLYLLTTLIFSSILYILRTIYLKTSRNLKRLEASKRSPIYTHMIATLNGLSTIRAFDAQPIVCAEFDYYHNRHSSGYFLFLISSRAFAFWLDCCCVIYISIITVSFFLSFPNNVGDVGLAITQAISITNMVHWGMKQSAELNNTMTAMERLVEYENIKPEAEMQSGNQIPSTSWPDKGGIKFHNLNLRYSTDASSVYVLKSINLEVRPSEKIGIVGRTGAGKSSIINALYRLYYTDGSLLIDNIDIKNIGLYELRSRISIIPQEPVLFSGTMRYNLDPFNEYDDSKLWKALEEVKLKTVIAKLSSGLHSKISEGGTNFSVGQRQLICLARAILRENRILVMDEATANVDPETDILIQTTIRSKFKDCTVLTIAHRLHTIIWCDKILVLQDGRVVEFGSPYELLSKSEVKIFHGMVKKSGKTTFDYLFKVAQKTYDENRCQNDSRQLLMAPWALKDYILKFLEPITNHPVNAKIQKTLFFEDINTKF